MLLVIVNIGCALLSTLHDANVISSATLRPIIVV